MRYRPARILRNQLGTASSEYLLLGGAVFLAAAAGFGAFGDALDGGMFATASHHHPTDPSPIAGEPSDAPHVGGTGRHLRDSDGPSPSPSPSRSARSNPASDLDVLLSHWDTVAGEDGRLDERALDRAAGDDTEVGRAARAVRRDRAVRNAVLDGGGATREDVEAAKDELEAMPWGDREVRTEDEARDVLDEYRWLTESAGDSSRDALDVLADPAESPGVAPELRDAVEIALEEPRETPWYSQFWKDLTAGFRDSPWEHPLDRWRRHDDLRDYLHPGFEPEAGTRVEGYYRVTTHEDGTETIEILRDPTPAEAADVLARNFDALGLWYLRDPSRAAENKWLAPHVRAAAWYVDQNEAVAHALGQNRKDLRRARAELRDLAWEGPIPGIAGDWPDDWEEAALVLDHFKSLADGAADGKRDGEISEAELLAIGRSPGLPGALEEAARIEWNRRRLEPSPWWKRPLEWFGFKEETPTYREALGEQPDGEPMPSFYGDQKFGDRAALARHVERNGITPVEAARLLRGYVGNRQVSRARLQEIVENDAYDLQLRSAAHFLSQNRSVHRAIAHPAPGKHRLMAPLLQDSIPELERMGWGGPTAGVEGAVDTPHEAHLVVDRYAFILDRPRKGFGMETKAKNWKRDGNVSTRDLELALDRNHELPHELEQAIELLLSH